MVGVIGDANFDQFAFAYVVLAMLSLTGNSWYGSAWLPNIKITYFRTSSGRIHPFNHLEALCFVYTSAFFPHNIPLWLLWPVWFVDRLNIIIWI